MNPNVKSSLTEVPLARRSFLKAGASLLGAGAMAPLLGACGASSSSGGGSLVFASYGGLFQQTLRSNILTPAQKALKITIKDVSGADTVAPLAAMVEGNRVAWSLEESTDSLRALEQSKNLLENLDTKSLTVSDLDSRYVQANGVAWCSYANNFFSNTKVLGSNGPKTAADLFNTKKFPGRRYIGNTADPAMQLALLADGVAPAKLYPLDLNRAFAKLTELRKTGQGVFTDLNSGTNQVSQQDVVMGFLNTTRLIQMKKDGVPITWGWEQYIVDLDWLTIPKGGPDRAAAYKLINYFVSPEPQAKLPTVFGYGVVNQKAVTTLSVSVQKNLPLTPYTKAGAITNDADWWRVHGNEADQMMTKWLAG